MKHDKDKCLSRTTQSISKDEEKEINEIMTLLEDKSFYLKCKEFDREFENDFSLSTSQ